MLFYPPQLYFRDRWIFVPLVGVILIQMFLWWHLAANIRPDAVQVFLHYNVIVGVDLVGDWVQIFHFPAFGVGVLLLNYIGSWLLYTTDKFLARLLAGWVLFFHLFLLAGIIFLVRLNS